MNITVLYGGKSSEHEVSLVSASSVVRNIDTNHTLHLIGISKENRFFLQPQNELERVRADEKAVLKIDETNEVFFKSGGGTAEAFYTKAASIPTDVVFPVTHGSFGEDGTLQGLLEMLSLPYVGAGVLGSAVAMDKEKAKIIWRANGLPVVPFITLRRTEWLRDADKQKLIAKIEKDLEYPVFVKPCNAGSSVGASQATTRTELISSVEDAFLFDDRILVEVCVPAREIECSVTGNDVLTAYIPGEIISTHKFYDYDAKYIDPNGAALEIPAQLSQEQRKLIRELAMKAYISLELKGFARVDFFIDKRNNNVYLNEVNTIPGFTPISMFPKMCAASGLPYNELIIKLLNLAVEVFNQRQSLHRSK